MEFEVGQHVTWLFVPKGGYGYALPIDAEIIGLYENSTRARIRVRKKTGEIVSRIVHQSSLRQKTQ